MKILVSKTEAFTKGIEDHMRGFPIVMYQNTEHYVIPEGLAKILNLI